MYILIKSRLASKLELETVYTLDEALKLYALHCMDMDIERGQAEELEGPTAKVNASAIREGPTAEAYCWPQ